MVIELTPTCCFVVTTFVSYPLQVGAEYAASIKEQERQVEALILLEQTLATMSLEGVSCEGVSMQLYHPEVRAAMEEMLC